MLHKSLAATTLLLMFTLFLPTAQAQSDADWNGLKQQVQQRAAALDKLIAEADGNNVATGYANVSRHVIATYLIAAQYDKEHVEQNRKLFQGRWWHTKTDPKEADNLPWKELKACIEVADRSIAELQSQIDGSVKLKTPPNLLQGKIKFDGSGWTMDDKPIFPYSLTWLPGTPEYTQTLGNIGGTYYQLTNLQDDGTVGKRVVKKSVTSIQDDVKGNSAPLVHLMGHAPAPWMAQQHPEIVEGARNFTKYDIDSPLVRQWIDQLCGNLLPAITNAAGDQPQVHLLANEPHFATAKGGWKARNGVSKLTMQKYRDWLAKKYSSVDALNAAQGSQWKSFDDVAIEMPINPKLRGSAVWYDWCRFNMDRVNDWFTFLKQTTQSHDPARSPVSIKLLGHTLGSEERDGGMDIEYLTKLQEVPGADLRVVPDGATFYGKNEDGRDTATGWAFRYDYLWVDQSMMLDFSRSLCPDRPFYDSEWHGFGTVSWRHYRMKPEYVRSSMWMAFTHGMRAIKPWLWGRDLNGMMKQADHIGELATQPVAVDAYGRVMKELNAHAVHVIGASPSQRNFLIYYCEETAIQDEHYMPHMTEVYEALKILNVTVGFVTPSDIGSLDPKVQTVIVSPTQFISAPSLAKLEKFAQSGGRIVQVGGNGNFSKTELGAKRKEKTSLSIFADLPMADVPSMADALAKKLERVTPALPLEVRMEDAKGEPAYGVIMTQHMHPSKKAVSIVLNNVANETRTISIEMPKGVSGKQLDAITNQPVENEFAMEPCDVRVIVFLR